MTRRRVILHDWDKAMMIGSAYHQVEVFVVIIIVVEVVVVVEVSCC